MNSDLIKRYAIEGGLAFAASFLTILGNTLATVGAVNLTASSIWGLVIGAVFAAIKVVADKFFVPVHLGGRKGV